MSTDAAKNNSLPEGSGKSFEQLLKKHRTFALVLKAKFEPFYTRIPRFACGPTPEADQRRFERTFRPWPKWVFRLGAEVWHVRYPTIPKEIFFETFRVVNAIMFRPPADIARSLLKPGTMTRINPEAIQVVMASFLGHSIEHFVAFRKELDERKQSGELSEKEYAEQIKALSQDAIEDMIRDAFVSWSNDKNVKPTDLTRALEDARRQTFDRHGNPKETPLTPIYQVMLSNWIIVEKMTGPKELANFLSPNSKGTSKFAEREATRIATMCSRIGLRFRGRVKEF